MCVFSVSLGLIDALRALVRLELYSTCAPNTVPRSSDPVFGPERCSGLFEGCLTASWGDSSSRHRRENSSSKNVADQPLLLSLIYGHLALQLHNERCQ